MKINEAPEKLYTDSSGNNPMPKRYWDSDIEYTRTDAFIEKAVEWISNNCYIPHATLEDFKNYMKGE